MSPLLKDAAINGVLHILYKDRVRPSAIGLLCLALAFPLFLLALAYIAYALYTALLPAVGQPLSLLYTGLGLTALSGGIAYTGSRLSRKKPPKEKRINAEEINKIIHEVVKELEDDLSQSILNNPKATLTTAAVAGFITGKNIQ